MRAISQAAKLGDNYIQQLLKDESKDPGIDRLSRVLRAMGTASTLYVIAGVEVGPEDEALLSAVMSLDPDLKQRAAAFFESLQAPGRTLGPAAEPPPATHARGQKVLKTSA